MRHDEEPSLEAIGAVGILFLYTLFLISVYLLSSSLMRKVGLVGEDQGLMHWFMGL